MLDKTITAFKQYLAANGIKQYEIAEQLGVEKGHLNRILNGKRNLTTEIAIGMKRIMGEESAMSLEECMEKYPLGMKGVVYYYTIDGISYSPFFNNDVDKLSQIIEDFDNKYNTDTLSLLTRMKQER